MYLEQLFKGNLFLPVSILKGQNVAFPHNVEPPVAFRNTLMSTFMQPSPLMGFIKLDILAWF